MQALFRLLSLLRAANSFRHHTVATYLAVLSLPSVYGVSLPTDDGGAIQRDHRHESRARFLREMPATVRANHPAILPVAAAIRSISNRPLEQLVMVNDVTHLLVDYDDDERVYGRTEFHATLDEMIARRREAGWIYLRDDCDGRAVFAAHLLAALGIPWRLEASYWMQHAWVVARVNGVDYDLLDFGSARPDAGSLGYQLIGRHFVHVERRPPFFAWRSAWRQHVNADLNTGKRLGLLTLDSTAECMIERYATDWTKVHPGGHESPPDDQLASGSGAGFPYGESLQLSGARVVRRKIDAAQVSPPRVALRAAEPR